MKSNNSKNVFWEALLITIFVFILGFSIGTYFEKARVNDLNEFYSTSEINLVDGLALMNLIPEVELEDDCEVLKKVNLNFADKIYREAKLLEQYEEAEKIGESLKILHRKYDLLRTFVWMNSFEVLDSCKGSNEEFHVVVYLYEYNTEDLAKKATQNVWSRILGELKSIKEDEIVLIPIAVDNDLDSLNLLLSQYDIKKYPVVIIDNKIVVDELKSVK
jgi:hypothetical protein